MSLCPHSLAFAGARRRVGMLLGALVLAAGLLPSSAGASTPPETVIQDDAVLLHSDDAGVKAAMDQIKSLGIDRIRVTAGWSVIAPRPDSPTRPDFDPTDPAAYPAGNWANLDRAVRDANAAGLKVMIDIAFWAPRWATHDDPSATDRLRTDIDPQQYAQFAQAVAKRYSGSYTPPVPPAGQPAPQPEPSPDANLLEALFGKKSQPPPAPAPAPALTPLPAVDMFTIWNEPNHPGFVMPQWVQVGGQWVPHSPDVYRAMVYAAYPAIKAAAPGSRVLIGGTASMGSSTPGKSGVPPLRFLRALACVDDHYRPITTGSCANFTPLPGDGWAHHPYSLRTLPNAMPHDPDKAPVAATSRLAFALRVLAHEHRLSDADQNLYLTEYGYETSPPDPQAVFPPSMQAQLLAWAEYLGESNPQVRMWPQFLLRDRPGDPAGPQMRAFGDWQTGLFYADGTPKPAAADFRTPTFATCVPAGKRKMLMLWGRLRDSSGVSAQVEVSKVADAWAAVASAAQPRPHAARAASAAAAPGGGAVVRYVPLRRGARYRLQWVGRDGTVATGPSVTPIGCSAGKTKKR
jgi:hypothetical protein